MSNHSVQYAFCRVTYWKDHSASTADDDWTRCKVSPLGMYSYGEKDCSFCGGEGEVTEQRYQLYLDRMKERARVWEEARKKAEESQ